MEKLYAKWKAYPTFKIYINLALLVEIAVLFFELLCQWRDKQDAATIIQYDLGAIVGTLGIYSIKAGLEHSKLATPNSKAVMQNIIKDPQTVAAAASLVQGDIPGAVETAMSVVQQAQDNANNQSQDDTPDNGVNNNMAG